jgi:hypothetical protein
MVKTKTGAKSAIISIERIAASIYLIRRRKVMIDSDLALLYGVETRVLVQLARMVAKHDRQIAVLFENVQRMLDPAPAKKNPIGFVPPKD